MQRPQFILKRLAELGHECFFYDSNPPYEGAEHTKEPYSPIEGVTVLPPHYDPNELGDFSLYFSNPVHYNWIDKYSPEFVIFDNLDLPVANQTKDDLRKCCTRSDLVLNVSDYLMEFASKYVPKENSLYIPNGVDMELYDNTRYFEGTRYDKLDVDDYDKIIGYTGVFWKETTDWELFLKIAESFPDDAFVCSGAFFKDYGELPDNMKFVGHVERNLLPAVISSFDVAVIPFLENEFTEAMCPLKVYEYLACGRQILSTPIPEVAKLRNRSIAKREKFIPRLRQLLKKEQTDRAINSRINEARKHDWDKVLEPLEEIL